MLGVSMHEGWIANSGGRGYLLAQVAPPERPVRGVWPLLTVETEVNGDSKSTNERGPFLGWFVGLFVSVQEIFVLPHGCSVRPYTISNFVPIAHQARQAAVLGLLSLSVCLWTSIVQMFMAVSKGKKLQTD